MKTKKILLLLIPVLALCFAFGAAGVLKIDSRAENKAPDKLVGIFITSEHLDMPAGEDRIYADGTEFNGLEGIRCFFTLQEDGEGSYYATTADVSASDRRVNYISSDSGERVEQELTLYMQRRPGTWTLFMNPVHQSGDGAIYVQTGQGMSCPSDTAGETASTSLSEDSSITDGRETKTAGSSVKVNVKVIDSPESVRILEFDSENALISEQSFDTDDVPESINPDRETAYIIVESLLTGESIQRGLYQQTDEYLETFSGADNGLLIKRQTEINW